MDPEQATASLAQANVGTPSYTATNGRRMSTVEYELSASCRRSPTSALGYPPNRPPMAGKISADFPMNVPTG